MDPLSDHRNALPPTKRPMTRRCRALTLHKCMRQSLGANHAVQQHLRETSTRGVRINTNASNKFEQFGICARASFLLKIKSKVAHGSEINRVSVLCIDRVFIALERVRILLLYIFPKYRIKTICLLYQHAIRMRAHNAYGYTRA